MTDAQTFELPPDGQPPAEAVQMAERGDAVYLTRAGRTVAALLPWTEKAGPRGEPSLLDLWERQDGPPPQGDRWATKRELCSCGDQAMVAYEIDVRSIPRCGIVGVYEKNTAHVTAGVPGCESAEEKYA